jgi:hypothetical protein
MMKVKSRQIIELGRTPAVETAFSNSALQRVQLRAAQAEARQQNSAELTPRQLKLWHDDERAMPTVLARSALFAPICNGQRKHHIDALIDGRSDAMLTYTGYQCDMGDADLFMQVLEFAKRYPLGTRFIVSRAQLLAAIGRSYPSAAGPKRSNIGSSQYKWLDEAMGRLREGVLTYTIKATPKRAAYGGKLNLVNTWHWDDATESYLLSIEPQIEALFAVFSRIYIQKHLALPKRDQLAKWMHLYVAGCAKNAQTNIGLDFLRMWSGNKERRIDHFERSMVRALGELSKVGIIGESYYIRSRDRMVCFERIV